MTFSNKHGWSDRLKIGLCLFVLCLGLSSNAAAQNDVVGRWSRFSDLPFFPAHSHVLPTGKVMICDGAFALGTEARLWDPATATVSPLTTPGYNIFCSGHAFLANGRLVCSGRAYPTAASACRMQVCTTLLRISGAVLLI